MVRPVPETSARGPKNRLSGARRKGGGFVKFFAKSFVGKMFLTIFASLIPYIMRMQTCKRNMKNGVRMQ